MKKILLSAFTFCVITSGMAQGFFTKTCYRGAFAPAPAAPWTDNWTEWDPKNEVYPVPTVTINSNITSNQTWSAGQTVLLQGPIYVTGNSILTIQPGVVIRAAKNLGTALIVTRGSQLIANGTAAAPIVFTSAENQGSRLVGDWGGIILLGRATNNYSTGVNYIEGLPNSLNSEHGVAGSPPSYIDSDNSGSLKYVRIEFGGYQYQPNQEINGLTMGSVGRGTTLEHIQVSFTNDDAFEWFGGTVNAKYLISYRNVDDDFDTDNGFSGNIQFGLIVRDPDLADAPLVSTSEGFESDNNAGGTATSVLTSAIFSNITMVGPYRGASTNTVESGYRRAVRIRRASNLRIYNSIFMDTQRGLHIDGSLSEAAATAGGLKFKNNIIAGTGNGRITEVNSGSSFNAPAFFGANSNDSIVYSNAAFAALLTTPYNYTSPDYRPSATSMARSGASFTDGVIAASTNTTASAIMAMVPSLACIGSGTTLSTYTFAASSTVTSLYCSLSWSASPGVTISNSTAANPVFTVSTIGTFTVYLTVADGDGSKTAMSSITTNTCGDVSIRDNNINNTSVTLFPNPAKDEAVLNVKANNTGNASVSIYDITGKLVQNAESHSVVAGENKIKLDTRNLNNGIYFVTLSSNQSKETVKLIINR